MNRQEHLQWAKGRALEYVDAGDTNGAFASITSDLGKHPETQGHGGLELGMMLILGGQLRSPAEMRNFIDGFN